MLSAQRPNGMQPQLIHTDMDQSYIGFHAYHNIEDSTTIQPTTATINGLDQSPMHCLVIFYTALNTYNREY